MTPWLELVGGTNPHEGARALWRSTVGQRVPGFSNTRWYSKAEIQFVLAEHFHKLQPFLSELDARGYGEAARQKLHAILDDLDAAQRLQLQLAAMLDLRTLVRTTYELEGDRLEILLVYDRIEALRAFGRSLTSEGAGKGLLPNVDAVLRSSAKLEVGMEVEKMFSGFGVFRGQIIAVETVVSTLNPGQERTGFTVNYPYDDTQDDFEEEEIRPLLYTMEMEERKKIIQAIAPAFEYLESRVSGTCDQQFSCSEMYEVCRLARAFDPMYAASHLCPDGVAELSKIKSLAHHVPVADLQRELPTYMSLAKEVSFSRDDVNTYSSNILAFWRNTPAREMSAWRTAAKVVPAIILSRPTLHYCTM